MKIKYLDKERILFDNGNEITYEHIPDCCKWNYADFEQIEELALITEFDEDLTFESVEGEGFRFGNHFKMFFIPCYSEQNGYYSSDLDIYYNGARVSNVECLEVG